jgi:hypothetical protein
MQEVPARRRSIKVQGMRKATTCACLLGLTGLMGCTIRGPLIVREPVGPERPEPNLAASQGRLIVYSATRVSSFEQSEYPVHTAYTIYALNDRVVREVGLRDSIASGRSPCGRDR